MYLYAYVKSSSSTTYIVSCNVGMTLDERIHLKQLDLKFALVARGSDL